MSVTAVGVTKQIHGSTSASQWILRECSVQIPRGSLTAIVGSSGAGKTSFLYCLSGLDQPTSGRVYLEGTAVHELGAEKRAQFMRSTVGFVFQEYNLIPYLTVEENVVLPEQLAHRRIQPEHVVSMLERFGLTDKRKTLASALSGGEQQRVALRRAMLLHPQIVFADEPTGALDTANTGLVLQILRDLTAQGTTVVMVTHDTEAAALADRVVFMRDGTITGTSERLTGDEIVARMHQLPPSPVNWEA